MNRFTRATWPIDSTLHSRLWKEFFDSFRMQRPDAAPWTTYCITRREAARGRFDAESKVPAEIVMTEPFISRGFLGRRKPASIADRLPPGQYETRDFPVLSAGPTPHTPLTTWDFTLRGANGSTARWSWEEFEALPHERVKTDIHCVTKWSKLDTDWAGVPVDTLLAEAAKRGVHGLR
jgi:hypothetical protein